MASYCCLLGITATPDTAGARGMDYQVPGSGAHRLVLPRHGLHAEPAQRLPGAVADIRWYASLQLHATCLCLRPHTSPVHAPHVGRGIASMQSLHAGALVAMLGVPQ